MRTAIIHLAAMLILAVCSTGLYANEDASDSGASFDDKLAACGACHGENGDQPLLPEYPILAGQYEGYLANALRQYRDGQRTNQIMALQIEILELTDHDIDKLASHFSGKSSNLHGLAD